jgi:signal transduction histidine kinase
MKIISLLFSLFLSLYFVNAQDRVTTYKDLIEQSFLVKSTKMDSLTCENLSEKNIVKMLAKENWDVRELYVIDCLVRKTLTEKDNPLIGMYYYIGGKAYDDFDDEIKELYFQKAYVYFESKNDVEGMFFSLSHLFNAKINNSDPSFDVTSNEIAKLFEELNQISKNTDYALIDLSLSESKIRKVLRLREKISVTTLDSITNFALQNAANYRDYTSGLFTVLGIAYQRIKEKDKAIRLKRKALNLANPNKRDYSSYFANIADYHFQNRDLDSTKYYLKKSYNLIPKETNSIYLLSARNSVASSLSSIYKRQKKIDSALKYSIQSNKAKTKLINLKLARNSSYADKKFEVQKKELQLARKNAEIKIKNKEQAYLIVILCLFILLLAILLVYYIQTKKLKSEALELVKKREKVLRTLNHDLFSPLQVFSSTAYLIPQLIAKKRFAQLEIVQESLLGSITGLQNTLNELFNWNKEVNFNSNMILHKEKNLSKEIEFIIAIYINFAKNRELKIESNITKNITRTIFCAEFGNLIRNLVFNAVKHGLSKSLIYIEFKEVDKKNILFSCQNTFAKTELRAIENLISILESKKIGKNTDEGLGLGLILEAVKKLNITITGEIKEDLLIISCVFPE